MIIWIRTRKGWVGGIFFALVAIFAISFIIGGVGTGSQASLSDIIGNNGGGAGTSTTSTAGVGELLKRVKANPKNAVAWQQLADAYAAQQNPALEATAWGHVVKLKPADMDSYQRLALAQAQVATNNSNQAQSLQQQALTSSPGNDSTFSGGTLGTLSEDPVTQAQAASEQEQQTKLLTQAGKIGKKADVWWKRSTVTSASSSRSRRSRRTISRRLSGSTTARPRRPRATEDGDQGVRGVPQDRAGRRQRSQVKKVITQLKASEKAASTSTTTTP